MMKWMLLCAAITATSGCATTAPVGGPDVACNSFEVIRPSRADTPDTKRQILVHNRTWRTICGSQ